MKQQPENNLGLQTKKFSEKVGLTERQVRNYCDLNVFNPTRPADAANERRYFTETDFKVAELIHILEKLGHGPKEIAEMFKAKNHDLERILDNAIKDMKRRIIHEQNLVEAAEYAQSLGTSLFSFSNMSDKDIDKFASTVRKTEAYKRSKRALRSMTREELEALNDRLKQIAHEFGKMAPTLDDEAQFSENFHRIESLSDDYVLILSEPTGGDPLLYLFSMGCVLAWGDGLLCSQANEAGGPGTAEIMGACFLLSWFKKTSNLIFPLITLLAADRNSGVNSTRVLAELFSLLDPTDESSAQITLGDTDPLEQRVGYIEMVFDMAKDFTEDDDLVQMLSISKSIVPSKEQLDFALKSLTEYAYQNIERKEN